MKNKKDGHHDRCFIKNKKYVGTMCAIVFVISLFFTLPILNKGNRSPAYHSELYDVRNFFSHTDNYGPFKKIKRLDIKTINRNGQTHMDIQIKFKLTQSSVFPPIKITFPITDTSSNSIGEFSFLNDDTISFSINMDKMADIDMQQGQGFLPNGPPILTINESTIGFITDEMEPYDIPIIPGSELSENVYHYDKEIDGGLYKFVLYAIANGEHSMLGAAIELGRVKEIPLSFSSSWIYDFSRPLDKRGVKIVAGHFFSKENHPNDNYVYLKLGFSFFIDISSVISAEQLRTFILNPR